MKNTLIKKINTLKPLLFAVLLLAGFIVVSANNWSAPSSAPTSNNSSAPINEGTPSQEKKGVLTLGGLLNMAHGPIVTYSPFVVGDANNAAKASFYGNLNLFGIIDTSDNSDKPLCTMSNGKVKICSQGVLFEPVKTVYYTDQNNTTFPTSTGVTGAVKYNIDQSVSCTTVATTNTNWANGTTLTGSNNSYSVIFYDWGEYDLRINCTNNKSYVSRIFIKGRGDATPSGLVGKDSNQFKYYYNALKLYFSSDRTLQIKLVGSGASGVNAISSGCKSGIDGEISFAHVTTDANWDGYHYGNSFYASPNVAIVDGGKSAKYVSPGLGAGCGSYTFKAGVGGTVLWKSGSLNTYLGSSLSGYNAGTGSSTPKGGCSGAHGHVYNQPDVGCTDYGSGATLSGQGYGGGGAAYVDGMWNIKAGEYLYLFATQGAGSASTGEQGVYGRASVEWY